MSERAWETPAALGYRMPAEWAPHEGTWLTWPHNRETWPDKFGPVEPAVVEIVRALAPQETVHINVLDADHDRHVRALLSRAGVMGRVELHRIPSNDAWCRDHGAIIVTRDAVADTRRAAIKCRFNGWGDKYPPYDLDDAIAERMAAQLDLPVFHADMVLEGGSIDVNGAGTLLTSEQCLLNPNRNPTMDRAGIEARLRDLFGVSTILWLGEGIVGDDTDGHVDDLARFVAPHTVVTVLETDPGDENYRALRDNRERLAGMTAAGGAPLEIVELPMPGAKYEQGRRLPASYANFYIANGVVLVPVFGDPMDREAERILAHCFPTRRVVPIECLDLVWGLGTIHCLTQQIPAA
jgi:agmatine deiminase